MGDFQPTHEAIARRRGEGFVATCSCGWIGRDRGDRRSASRDGLEHEGRAPHKERRRLAANERRAEATEERQASQRPSG